MENTSHVTDKNVSGWLNGALGLGIAAFFLAEFGLVTLIAVGVNIKAWTVRSQATSGTWKVIVGSILSGLGLLTYLSMYGHL